MRKPFIRQDMDDMITNIIGLLHKLKHQCLCTMYFKDIILWVKSTYKNLGITIINRRIYDMMKQSMHNLPNVWHISVSFSYICCVNCA